MTPLVLALWCAGLLGAFLAGRSLGYSQGHRAAYAEMLAWLRATSASLDTSAPPPQDSGGHELPPVPPPPPVRGCSARILPTDDTPAMDPRA